MIAVFLKYCNFHVIHPKKLPCLKTKLVNQAAKLLTRDIWLDSMKVLIND